MIQFGTDPMNWKLSLTPKLFLNVFSIIVGLGLLVGLVFYFNVLLNPIDQLPSPITDQPITKPHSILPFDSPISNPTNPVPLISTMDWKVYTSPNREFSFKYPSTWKMLKQPPEDHKYENGKMFYRSCDLFIQNTKVKSTLIAIELPESRNSGGDYCWSRGTFSDHFTRRITSLNPPKDIVVTKWGAGSRTNTSWQGEYFQQIDLSNITFALIYKNGVDQEAEQVFDQILASFQE